LKAAGFRKMRLYFSTAFQDKTADRSQQIKPPFQPKKRSTNKAAAAFEKHGFISARPFNTKQPGGHKKRSSPLPKPPAVAKAVCRCQSRSPL
jgi:hypothetical protein